MAAVNSTRSSGIKVEQYQWGIWIKGTREQLIQKDYAQSAPFPGDPGRNKYTLKTTDAHGRAISIARTSKTTFSVSRRWTNEEQTWYDKREAKKQEAERIAKIWPKTASAFRQDSINAANCSIAVFQNVVLNGNKGGWRYDDATTHKIERLIDQIFGLIETGGVVEDMALKERNTPACIADVVSKLAEPRYKVEGNIIHLGR